MSSLRFLHNTDALNAVKLDSFRRLSTDEILDSLKPGTPGCLKARQDGTVLDGHHRLVILLERGVDIDNLPREIIEKES